MAASEAGQLKAASAILPRCFTKRKRSGISCYSTFLRTNEERLLLALPRLRADIGSLATSTERPQIEGPLY
jgi:hypothetical protein